MPEGMCALCLKTAELQDSHLIPKAIYKLLRSVGDDNENPVFVAAGSAVNTSRQIKGYLLCKACETLFNERGERWVLGNCRRSETEFRILDALKAAKPMKATGDPIVFEGRKVKGVDVDSLAYFAVSVFWRASVREWMTGKDERLHIDLGPYQQELRQFLIGAGAFPKNAIVFVSVTSGADVKANEFMFFPFLKNREPTHRQYAFMVPGLSFQLIVGREIPPNLRTLCTVASPEGFIFQSETMEERTLVEARELYKGTKGT